MAVQLSINRTRMMTAILFIDGVIGLVCCVIAVTDHRRGIIPDWCNALILAGGVALSMLTGHGQLMAHLIDSAIVLVLFLLLRFAYRRFRGYAGLGLGDVKFLTAATLCVGLAGLQLLVLIACLTGLTEALVRRLVLKENLKATTRLRFGPHLALALILVLALQQSNYW